MNTAARFSACADGVVQMCAGPFIFTPSPTHLTSSSSFPPPLLLLNSLPLNLWKNASRPTMSPKKKKGRKKCSQQWWCRFLMCIMSPLLWILYLIPPPLYSAWIFFAPVGGNNWTLCLSLEHQNHSVAPAPLAPLKHRPIPRWARVQISNAPLFLF